MKKLLVMALALCFSYTMSAVNPKTGLAGIGKTMPGQGGSGEQVIPGSHGGGIQKIPGSNGGGVQKLGGYEIVAVTGMGLAQGDIEFTPNAGAAKINLSGNPVYAGKGLGLTESLYAICKHQKCVLRENSNGKFYIKHYPSGRPAAGSVGYVPSIPGQPMGEMSYVYVGK